MIAVFGATGTTGSGVVRTMAAQGKPVRAVVRKAAQTAAAKQFGAGVDIVAAELDDAAALRAALDGVSHVYCGLGRAANLVELEQHVVDAARAAGVTHYVKSSGVTVGVDRPSVIQKVHGQLEDYVRANLPGKHTILGCNFFMQNFFGMAGAIKSGVLPMPTGEARAGLVDAADIVRCAVSILDASSQHQGKRYQITGPAALSHGDAAATFTKVLGRPVQFVNVSEADFVAGCVQAGLPRWFAEVLADVYVRFFAAGDAAAVSDDVRLVTGQAPRALEAWVRDNAQAFA